MKKVSFVLLAVLMTFAIVGCGTFGPNKRSTVTFYSAPQMYEHVNLGYNEGEFGPITVTEGVLKDGKTSKKVYVIGLSGTDMVKNQSTGLLIDLLSGFCLDNDYLRNVVSVINVNIPKNSNLILTGHSLGGMVAQQVAADKSVKDGYNVLNTLTFGSPLLAAGSREGSTIRLGDTFDAVPYLSGSLFNNTLWAIFGLNREDGGYWKKMDFEGAHVKSYAREDLWGKYDAIGKKNGSAKIVLDMDTLVYYHSPSGLPF